MGSISQENETGNGLGPVRQHSLPFPVDTYAKNANYFSRFAPRVSKYRQQMDDVVIRCQIDYLGRDGVGKVVGTLNPAGGSWSALVYPDCMPSRAALVAYTNEAAFMNDDDVDDEEARACLMSADLLDKDMPVTPSDSFAARNRATIHKLARQIIKESPDLGANIIRGWNLWKHAQRRMETTIKSHRNLDEYLDDRKNDSAWELIIAQAAFAVDIHLTPEDEAAAAALQKPLWIGMALHNDFFSWEKERKCHHDTRGKVPLINAVALHMQWHSISEEEAKKMVMREMHDFEEQYHQMKSKLLASRRGGAADRELLRWVDAMEHVVTGNLQWSRTCPRYMTDRGGKAYVEYMRRREGEGVDFEKMVVF